MEDQAPAPLCYRQAQSGATVSAVLDCQMTEVWSRAHVTRSPPELPSSPEICPPSLAPVMMIAPLRRIRARNAGGFQEKQSPARRNAGTRKLAGTREEGPGKLVRDMSTTVHAAADWL